MVPGSNPMIGRFHSTGAGGNATFFGHISRPGFGTDGWKHAQACATASASGAQNPDSCTEIPGSAALRVWDTGAVRGFCC